MQYFLIIAKKKVMLKIISYRSKLLLDLLFVTIFSQILSPFNQELLVVEPNIWFYNLVLLNACKFFRKHLICHQVIPRNLGLKIG